MPVLFSKRTLFFLHMFSRKLNESIITVLFKLVRHVRKDETIPFLKELRIIEVISNKKNTKPMFPKVCSTEFQLSEIILNIWGKIGSF